MDIAVGVALVLFLVLMVIWFAVKEEGPKIITASAYCLACVWLAMQLFLRLHGG